MVVVLVVLVVLLFGNPPPSFPFSSYEQYHKQAMQVRTKIKQDFEAVFHQQNIDFLVTPTCQVSQMPQGGNDPLEANNKDNNDNKGLTHGDVISEYVNDIMTMPASLAGFFLFFLFFLSSPSPYTPSLFFPGVPAISIPTTLSNRGLPVGIQMIGGWYQEGSLLRAAHCLSMRSGFGNKSPFNKN